MVRTIRVLVLVGATVLSAAFLYAQPPQSSSGPTRPAPAAAPDAPDQPPTQAAAKPPSLPLKVDVTLVRYRDDQKVSSLPYSLSVGADGGRAALRMGTNVMVGTGGDRQREQIGTYIDCQASALGDGRFQLVLSINDSSPYASTPGDLRAFGDEPVIRSLVVTNQVLTLRDGQTQEFVAATDKMTGEVTKAEVMLTVVK